MLSSAARLGRTLALVLTFCFSTGAHAQADPAKAQPGKRRVTIATIGHADHGKSTLTAAITGVLSDRGEGRFVSYDKVTDVSEIVVQRVRVAAARVEYETDTIRYDHIDCATNTDVTRLLSAEGVTLDGAILVVSAADGPMPQTREHLILANKRGLTSLIVYINKIDLADPELVDLVELEMRELLTATGFEADTVPFIRGSALMALTRTKPEIGERSILALLRALDSSFAK